MKLNHKLENKWNRGGVSLGAQFPHSFVIKPRIAFNRIYNFLNIDILGYDSVDGYGSGQSTTAGPPTTPGHRRQASYNQLELVAMLEQLN